MLTLNGPFVKRVLALFASLMLLSACATPGSYSSSTMTPAQAQMRDNSKALRKTVWQGVGIGAGTGALLGGLIGGSWKTAAIGAAAGAVAGGIAGSYVASKQKDYSSREQALDAMIADVRLKNQESDSMIASMETVAAENRRKLASADTRYQQDEISKSQYNRELASIRSDKKLIDDTIADVEEQHATFYDASQEFQQKNPEVNTAEFDDEVAGLQTRINTMSSISDELVTETG